MFPQVYFSDKLYAAIGPNEEAVLMRMQPKEAKSSSKVKVDKKKKQSERGCFQILDNVICNKLYMLILVARMVLLSVNAVLIFWLPTYLMDVIEIVEQRERLLLYIMIVLCSALIGGVICHLITYCINGYESRYGLLIAFVINFLTTAAFMAAPHVKQWQLFVACAMLYKIGISSIVPMLNGVILASTPFDEKSLAFTLLIIGNLAFGIGLSNHIYSYLYQSFKEHHKTLAMTCFTYYSLTAVLVLLCAAIVQYKSPSPDSKQQKPLPLKDINIPLRIETEQSEEENVLNLADYKPK